MYTLPRIKQINCLLNSKGIRGERGGAFVNTSVKV